MDPEKPAAVAWRAVLVVAAARLALHLACAGRYGYFRDELYFLDCGRHLDFGYVDHAPLIGLWARLALALGGSLVVLRAMAGIAGTALVVVAALLARELGGRGFAQVLAALAVAVVPSFVGMSSLFTMNVLEPLFWMAGALALVRWLRTGDERWWLAFGAALGLGLENKHSTAFFGVAVAAGVLLTPQRTVLARRWIWLAAALAVVLFLPNLVWQWAHGFPTLEDLRNVARSGKNVVLAPPAFVLQQALMLNPFLLPLWLGGLAWLVARSRWRMLGVAFLVFFGVMLAMHAKDYYLAPFYPLLFAAGAVATEERVARPALRALLVGAVLLVGLPIVPLVTPLLSPEGLLAYQEKLGVRRQKTEVAHQGPLPQMFGDQHGWPELVSDVATVWNRLTPAERARAAIFANNYGEAGAINRFGPALGLPPAISAHQTHFFWGPRDFRGDVLVVLQDSREGLSSVCASVEEALVHHHPWGMAEENDSIWVCRGLKSPLPEMWPRLKHWN